jgi:hypothetical protein
MIAAAAVRRLVMELQPLASRAAAAALVDEGALRAVPFPHRATNRRRDVPRPRRDVGVGE